MNPFILSFADGTTFFVGLVMVLATEGVLLRMRNRFARSILTVTSLLGVALVILSSTPLPLWAYTVWTTAAIVMLGIAHRVPLSRRAAGVGSSVLVASTLALCVMEVPFHRRPTLRVPAGATVYVIGDSISAGIGIEYRCWPMVLDETTSFRVANLSWPGATTANAHTQAAKISDPQSVVIVEIGGNDLFAGTSAQTFHNQLETLLSSLQEQQHAVLLLELPLFPFQNTYGKAQRGLARKYGAVILPKRYFARVLGMAGGTLDGLHLSQEGHNALAQTIAAVLKEQ